MKDAEQEKKSLEGEAVTKVNQAELGKKLIFSPLKERSKENSFFLDILQQNLWWVALVLTPLLILAVLFHYQDLVGSLFPEKVSGQVTLNEPSQNFREEFGQLGDAVGGLLNPMLSFLTIIFLIVTLKQNQKALRDNAEELQLSRKELELTRKELSAATEAHESISETQNYLRLEATFFKLLELSLSKYEKLEKGVLPDTSAMLESIRITDFSSDDSPLSNASSYAVYVRSLQRVLNLIDNNKEIKNCREYVTGVLSPDVVTIIILLGPYFLKRRIDLKVIFGSQFFGFYSASNFYNIEEASLSGMQAILYYKNMVLILEVIGLDAFSDKDGINEYYQRCKRLSKG